MSTPCGGTPKCIFNQPTSCTFYDGELLTTISLLNGETVTTALIKIDSYLANFDPVGAETSNSKTDSNSIAITLSGTANRNIQADVKISPNAGNKVSTLSNGLFAAPATSSLGFNSTTGLLTLTVDGVVSTQTIPTGNYSETVYGS